MTPKKSRLVIEVAFIVAGVIIIIWQGTLLRRAQQSEALAKAAQEQERLRAELIVASNPMAVVMCDSNRVITYVNPEAVRIFGWSYEELSGKDSNILIPKHSWQRHDEAFAKAAIAAKKMTGNWAIRRDIEGEGVTRSGEIVPLYFMIRTIRYEGNVEFIALMRVRGEELYKVIPLPNLESRVQEAQERAVKQMKK